ncbi:unnamed protein product [Closterium sp. NIES-54]
MVQHYAFRSMLLEQSPAATWQPPHTWRNSDTSEDSFSRVNHNFPFPQALGATFFPAFSTIRFLGHFLDSHPDRSLADMAPSSHVVIASVTVCAVVAIGVCYLCMRKKRRDGDGYDGPGQASAGTATATGGAAAAANGETRVPLLFSQVRIFLRLQLSPSYFSHFQVISEGLFFSTGKQHNEKNESMAMQSSPLPLPSFLPPTPPPPPPPPPPLPPLSPPPFPLPSPPASFQLVTNPPDWGDESEDIEQQSFPPSQPSASADQQAAAEAEAAEAARAARQKQWEEERRQAEAEAAEEAAAAAAAANKRARKEGGGRQGRVKFGESTVREYDAGEGMDVEGDAEAAAAAAAAAVPAAAIPDAAAAAKKKAARREGGFMRHTGVRGDQWAGSRQQGGGAEEREAGQLGA